MTCLPDTQKHAGTLFISQCMHLHGGSVCKQGQAALSNLRTVLPHADYASDWVSMPLIDC